MWWSDSPPLRPPAALGGVGGLSRGQMSLAEVQCHLDKEGASDLVIDLIMNTTSDRVFQESILLAIALLEGGNTTIQVGPSTCVFYTVATGGRNIHILHCSKSKSMDGCPKQNTLVKVKSNHSMSKKVQLWYVINKTIHLLIEVKVLEK